MRHGYHSRADRGGASFKRMRPLPKIASGHFRLPVIQLSGVYDCRQNRKAIFNRNMVPNINPNSRGRKHPKRGRKPLFDPAIFEERFRTIERLFAWKDKFRRLHCSTSFPQSYVILKKHHPDSNRNQQPVV
jgi:hypothetical protein